MYHSSFALLLSCLSFNFAQAPTGPAATASPSVNQIYQFAPGNWVEALRFRPNGQLLINLLSSPDVYQIDTELGTAVHVTSVPFFSGLYGITEGAPDQFYVAGGNFILSNSTHYHGTYAIYHLNMTTFEPSAPGSVMPQLLTTFPTAALNGLTTLSEDLILAADTDNGLIYPVNLTDGTILPPISDPATMSFSPNATLKLNVNGIAYVPSASSPSTYGYIYYTNTASGTFNRIPVSTADGRALGPGTTLATTPELRGGDDFDFDQLGNVYIADDPYNWLNIIEIGQNTTTIYVGGPNSTAALGPTSVRLGTSWSDVGRGSIYFGTSGGISQYQTGNFTVGGGVYRVDTKL